MPGTSKVKFGVSDDQKRWFRDVTVLKHLCMTGEKQSCPPAFAATSGLSYWEAMSSGTTKRNVSDRINFE